MWSPGCDPQLGMLGTEPKCSEGAVDLNCWVISHWSLSHLPGSRKNLSDWQPVRQLLGTDRIWRCREEDEITEQVIACSSGSQALSSWKDANIRRCWKQKGGRTELCKHPPPAPLALTLKIHSLCFSDLKFRRLRRGPMPSKHTSGRRDSN